MEPRHGGHGHGHESLHYANIPYGYYIAAASILHLVVLCFANWAREKRWPWTRFLIKIPLWILVPSYATLLTAVCFYHLDFDTQISTILKRFGRVAFALVPFNIIIALRPANWQHVLFGYYLDYLGLHKWTSRIILALLIFHGLGFLAKWILEEALFKALRLLNFLGVIIFTLLLILLFVSVKWMRRSFYKAFYVVHTLTAWLFVVLIAFHARPGALDLVIVLLVLIGYQIIQRVFLLTTTQVLDIKTNPLSTLLVIRLQKPLRFAPHYLAGSHIRLLMNRFNLLAPTHPFSLANTIDDPELILIASRTTFTRQLTARADCTLLGPYPLLRPSFFNSAREVQIIVGGSGISLGLPLFKYFSDEMLNTRVSLAWYVRNEADLFVVKSVDWPAENVVIYLTCSENRESPSSLDNYEANTNENESLGLLSDDIELAKLDLEDYTAIPAYYNVKKGRPPISAVLRTADHVVACGPPSLVNDARKAATSKSAFFHGELYEM